MDLSPVAFPSQETGAGCNDQVFCCEMMVVVPVLPAPRHCALQPLTPPCPHLGYPAYCYLWLKCLLITVRGTMSSFLCALAELSTLLLQPSIICRLIAWHFLHPESKCLEDKFSTLSFISEFCKRSMYSKCSTNTCWISTPGEHRNKNFKMTRK